MHDEPLTGSVVGALERHGGGLVEQRLLVEHLDDLVGDLDLERGLGQLLEHLLGHGALDGDLEQGLLDRLDVVALGAGLDQRLEHLGRDLAFDGGLDELVDDLLGLGFDLVGLDGVDEFFGYELLVHRVLILGGG